MHTVTKQYRDLPAAHRQPNHNGHCRLIHGHNWGFDIVFYAGRLDDNGFVIDVGTLQPIKEFLNEVFDHTLLLNEDDPFLDHLQASLQSRGTPPGYEGKGVETVSDFAKIVIVPNCGMEGLAKYVYGTVNAILSKHFPDDVSDRGLTVWNVTCFEDSKNSATYMETEDHDK